MSSFDSCTGGSKRNLRHFLLPKLAAARSPFVAPQSPLPALSKLAVPELDVSIPFAPGLLAAGCLLCNRGSCLRRVE